MNDHLKLSNRLFEVVLGNVTCMENWAFYLFDSEFDNEPELRNRIGVIWFCSLFDTLEASEHQLPKIAAEAQKLGFESLEHNAIELQKFCRVVGDLIAQYSREEQAFIVSMRNQYVHGYLNGRHQECINFKYYAHGRVVKEVLPFADYNDLIRGFFENGSTFDVTMTKLLALALNRTHLYWRLVEALRRNKMEIYKGIREGEKLMINLSENFNQPN